MHAITPISFFGHDESDWFSRPTPDGDFEAGNAHGLRFSESKVYILTSSAHKSERVGDFGAKESAIVFRGLVELWKRETRGISLQQERADHPSYQALSRLGTNTIPLLLVELRDRPDFYFEALRLLTGVNPAEAEPRFDDAVKAWIQWGEVNGYI